MFKYGPVGGEMCGRVGWETCISEGLIGVMITYCCRWLGHGLLVDMPRVVCGNAKGCSWIFQGLLVDMARVVRG